MTEIRSSDYFAIIPEWVLHAEISSNAVRLYGVLNRFANSRGVAWPSRKTIADLMGVSVATVDRAKDELVDIGALHIEHRTGPAGDPSSNLYTLATSVDNSQASSPMTKGSPKDGGTGSPKDDALNRANMKQSHIAGSSLRTCQECLGKNRAGYDNINDIDKTHLWDWETNSYIICPKCKGTGTQ